jgi:hypothetical protein
MPEKNREAQRKLRDREQAKEAEETSKPFGQQNGKALSSG